MRIVNTCIHAFTGALALLLLGPIACSLFLASAVPALAADTTVDLAGVGALVMPYLQLAAATAISAGVAWLASLTSRKLGLDIEGKHRDALQAALTNAAGLLIARGGAAAGKLEVDLKNPVLAAAVRYVLAAAPGALRFFKLDADHIAIAEKVLSKIPQIDNTFGFPALDVEKHFPVLGIGDPAGEARRAPVATVLRETGRPNA